MLSHAMKKRGTWYGAIAMLGLLVGVASAAAFTGCGEDESKSAQVQVTAPTDGAVVKSSRVTVRGTVSPPDATVQVLGQSAQVGNGVFTTSVPLKSGKNDIDVVAAGPGITPSTITFTVTRRTSSSTDGDSTDNQTGGGTTNNGGTQTGRTNCGDGISVGPNTTCVFARNVAATYNADPARTIEVYSPVTDATYTMTCTSGSPHVCTGGNNASVYFP